MAWAIDLGPDPAVRGSACGIAVVTCCMALVTVLLTSNDHECCGPRREVGDTVTMQIHNYRGQVYEERHPGGVDIATQPMTGTVVGIALLPAIVRQEVRPEGFTATEIEGYRPGVLIDSTDDDDPDLAYWAFQFTVDTDDPVPEPRKE